MLPFLICDLTALIRPYSLPPCLHCPPARQVLTHWADLTKHLRGGRSYAARCAAAHNAVRLSIAFLAWHELARLLSGARATAATRGAHLDTALQRKVLSGWLQELEAAQRRAAAAEELRERRVQAVLPAVLRAWAAVALANGARRLQRATLGHLVLRRCRQLQRRAFQVDVEERRGTWIGWVWILY